MIAPPTPYQRSIGDAVLCANARGIADLRMSGCSKLLFARNPDRVDAISINTSGGLTGGDRLSLTVRAEPAAQICVTTQAAERAYRASEGVARSVNTLEAATNSTLFWLPQELILFDGASLDRELRCELAESARFLMVEPVVFGRKLMGEQIRALHFHDRVAINRAGKPLYRDASRFDGDMTNHLVGRAVAQGAGAYASLLYVAPDAEACHAWVCDHLPPLGGAALLGKDVLVLRLLATDSFELRRSLLPLLDHLTNDTLPASWRL